MCCACISKATCLDAGGDGVQGSRQGKDETNSFAGSDRGSMDGWRWGPVAARWDGAYICGWPVGKFLC